MLLAAGLAAADTISPMSYTNDDLAVGESVTIQKTVVIEASGATDALIDAFFLIDTTGSMGDEVEAAKIAAADLLTGLRSFGDLSSGVGVFGERALLSDAIRSDLNTNDSITTTAIAAQVNLGDPDGGFDFPESSNTAIDLVANNASFRPGSNRFIFVLGDASAKGTPDADVIASLAAKNVNLVGINFGGSAFADDITDLGGTVFSSGADADEIVAAVTAGISAGFAEYNSVTVGDLGGGGVIGVSAVCTGADIGTCSGAEAMGDFDRATDRTFTFDVTFTRNAAGASTFPTYALVDGGIVARETDSFGDTTAPVIPLPAAGWLMLGGFGALAAFRRRKP
ncbi:hypothetical protein OCGS_0870 [Oceaniovalibus guishaninsula JLT2003]|uniref:VWFA domain-containing protein n=2 Tax=Oceaniovalibus TaxID=1207070 RepID=K2I838_9RHOB|nr:hypothetical protein OCGS_0870 [Oceaniovalibus guishaninsula JLT2003]